MIELPENQNNGDITDQDVRPEHQSVERSTRSKSNEGNKAGRSVISNVSETTVREGKYIVTGEVEAKDIIPVVVEDDEDEMTHLVYATEVTSDVGEPQSFQEAKKSGLGNLWMQSMRSEINNFLYRKVWIPTKIEKVRKLGRKPIPVKWVYKVKDEANGALLWLRTFGDYLSSSCGMKQSKVDPCIFHKKDETDKKNN